ncbi:MAG: hypothetical protein KDK37_04740, partial [Leptospiraceae bacterium]|nr:hypothetical protein [Leptospiraceae bacterium]
GIRPEKVHTEGLAQRHSGTMVSLVHRQDSSCGQAKTKNRHDFCLLALIFFPEVPIFWRIRPGLSLP